MLLSTPPPLSVLNGGEWVLVFGVTLISSPTHEFKVLCKITWDQPSPDKRCVCGGGWF